MYIISTEMEALNLDLFEDAAGCDEEATTLAPVVDLYTNALPAPAAALNPFVAELVQANDAIAATISELNMLVLNTANAAYRSQIKKVGVDLVAKAPLMQETKANYIQMLDAAEANAAYNYGKAVVDTQRTMSPYKRKYETASEISQHLGITSLLKEVASLYYVNAELIEQTIWLKKAFTDRKARLYRPSAAAA